MSGYNKTSNPFHPYNTRNKPIYFPQRTNAFVPWQSSNYVRPTNYTSTVTTQNPVNQNGPLLFISYGKK